MGHLGSKYYALLKLFFLILHIERAKKYIKTILMVFYKKTFFFIFP